MSNSSNKFFEGLFVGGALGFICGILLAPKSGAEFRRQIADQSDELYRQASEQIGDLREKSNAALSDLQSKSEQVIRQAKEQVQETRDQLASKLQDMGVSGAKVSVQEQQPDNNNT